MRSLIAQTWHMSETGFFSDGYVVLDGMAVGAQFLLAALFLAAGATKAVSPRDLQAALHEYGLLPPALIPAVSRLIPIIELALGGLWLATTDARLVAVPTLIALLTFMAGTSFVMQRGRIVDCGCSGLFASRRTGWSTLVRNFLLGVCVIAWMLLIGTAALPLSGAVYSDTPWSQVGIGTAWATFLGIVVLGTEEVLNLEMTLRSTRRSLEFGFASKVAK